MTPFPFEPRSEPAVSYQLRIALDNTASNIDTIDRTERQCQIACDLPQPPAHSHNPTQPQSTATKRTCNYGFSSEAKEGARRWVRNNEAVYRSTGKLLEKYNVEEIGLFAEGGEYTVQDGFGWTNGVLVCLLNDLEIE